MFMQNVGPVACAYFLNGASQNAPVYAFSLTKGSHENNSSF